jgi:hypothetical protein
LHVVRDARRLRLVENAFVPRLPKKRWRCEAPRRPGRTIGSSGSAWLKLHVLRKLIDARLSAACGAATPAPQGTTTDAMRKRVRAARLLHRLMVKCYR